MDIFDGGMETQRDVFRFDCTMEKGVISDSFDGEMEMDAKI